MSASSSGLNAPLDHVKHIDFARKHVGHKSAIAGIFWAAISVLPFWMMFIWYFAK